MAVINVKNSIISRPIKAQFTLVAPEIVVNKVVITAVYYFDIKLIQEAIQKVSETTLPQKRIETLVLVYFGFIEIIKFEDNHNYQPNKDVIQDLKSKIFSIPNFSAFKLELYANFMLFYD